MHGKFIEEILTLPSTQSITPSKGKIRTRLRFTTISRTISVPVSRPWHAQFPWEENLQ